MRRRAFTLVELLVVIAIIAMLVAVLLPSLAAARKSARLAAGTANLRSCGQIMLSYTGDNKGDFLNPFRKSWPSNVGTGELQWWHIVSPTDSTMYWTTWSSFPSYHTDVFAGWWYSYLAAYRGGGRLAPEMFSPADPLSYAVTKDFEQIAADQDQYLVTSTFQYSPAFWTKPEALVTGVRSGDMLRTTNLNAVLYPSKKVMIWDTADFKPKNPIVYAAIAARPGAMLVDGSVIEPSIEDLTSRINTNELQPPGKFAYVFPPGVSRCNRPDPLLVPDPSEGAPGYFAYTFQGINGRDIP